MRCKWLCFFLLFSIGWEALSADSASQPSEHLPVKVNKGENSNIFSSSLYDSYLEQLHSFVEREGPLFDGEAGFSPLSPFEREGLSFLEYAKGTPGKGEGERALYHRELFDRIRSLIAASKNSALFTFSVKNFGRARDVRCRRTRRTNSGNPIGEERSPADGASQPSKNLPGKVDKAENGKDSSPLERELKLFLQKLALWIFTEVHIEEELYRFIFSDVGMDRALESFEEEICVEELFPLFYQTIKSKPNFFDKSRRTAEMEDQIRQGDFPYHLSTFREGEKEVKLIRTPNVTRDVAVDATTGETVDAVVNEEFIQYIEAQKAMGKVHLYVNLMRREGDEGIKTRLIEGLEDGRTFFVLTLEKSKTPFYFQQEKFLELSDAALFKSQFIERLLAEDGDFHLPTTAYAQDWSAMLKSVIEKIHHADFSGKDRLDSAEREQFIELAYLEILHLTIALIKPDVMNISCRQSLDRGPSLYSLFLLEKELEKNRPDLFMVGTLFYAPPLLSLNRWSHDYRVNRFIESSSRLQLRKGSSFPSK